MSNLKRPNSHKRTRKTRREAAIDRAKAWEAAEYSPLISSKKKPEPHRRQPNRVYGDSWRP